MTGSRPRNGESGFSLVELIIAATIFVAIAAVAFLLSSSSQKMVGEDTAQADLDRRADAAINDIFDLVKQTGISAIGQGQTPQTVTVDQIYDNLSFKLVTGAVGGTLQWSEFVTFRWQLEPGEIMDGHDNDGDELVDEGQVVRIDRNVVLPGGSFQTTVIANGCVNVTDIDTGAMGGSGLEFEYNGTDIRIALTLAKWGPVISGPRTLYVARRETKTALRNQ